MIKIKLANSRLIMLILLLALSLASLSLVHARPPVVMAATTITVNSDADAGGTCPGATCTLRQALATAASGDTINFAAGITTITLTSTPGSSTGLFILKNLTITGPGANLLTIQRSTAPDTPPFRIFLITDDTNVTISGLTISNGYSDNGTGGQGYGILNRGTLALSDVTLSGNNGIRDGGAIFNHNFGNLTITNCNISGNSSDKGGGITNWGMMTIANSTISGNSASSFGGGIVNAGTLTVTNSTISGNSAPTGDAGGFDNYGTLTITNSTISGNSASGNAAGGSGGGIYNRDTATAVLTGCTLFGNSAKTTGGAIYNGAMLTLRSSTITGNTTVDNSSISSSVGGAFYTKGPVVVTNCTIAANISSSGGGIYISPSATPTVTVRNSIIATNTAVFASPDIGGATLSSQGYNLIGNNSGASIAPGTADQIGTPGAQINPLLGPLQNNGGPTLTRALLLGSPASPAIDKGHSSGSFTDQRGLARVVDSPSPSFANASGGDGSDIGAYEVQADLLPGCNTIVNNNNESGAGSLRDVIANACGGSTITFAANVRGTITLTSGELFLNKFLTINGPGADLLTIERGAAAGNFRIFTSANNINSTISGLTISHGSAADYAGGIFNGTGTMTISASIISGNSSANFGGGIVNTGTLTVTNSTISGNTATTSYGGGIDNSGTLIITNSIISGNSAASNLTGAGGIYNRVNATAVLTGCTLSGNSSGGGSSGGGAGIYNAGALSVTNSTISSNSASGYGGGIYNTGTLNLTNATISGNSVSGGIFYGGGIFTDGGMVAIINSTISNNTAQYKGGGIVIFTGTVTVRNTIIAQNSAGGGGGPDVSGALTSLCFNFIGNNKDATITPVEPSDQIGTPGSPLNPLLGPLQNNGGPTQTHALLAGSTAIDKGHSSGSNTDQRGFTRPIGSAIVSGGDGSDIGAFEVQSSTLSITNVLPPAGQTAGGQPRKLAGAFANLLSVTIGGNSATWIYTNGAGDTSMITVTTPSHAVGAVNIDLLPASGGAYSKPNAFAYLPTIFTDDTLVVGVTTAKAQHVIELRQAVDALRVVAGLVPASWTDATLLPASTVIKAVHITELRFYLDQAAGAGTYTDTSLSSGLPVKRIHVEELRQRIRALAG